MLKHFFTLLVLMSLFLILTGADAESSAEGSLRMPEGFEGIYLGMSIEELLKIRPKVNVNPKDSQLLEESTEVDSLYGLVMFGTYVFEDGKLVNALLVWAGDMEKIRKYRRDFLSFSIKRWGRNFQKKIVTQRPDTKDEHLMPVLLWYKGNTAIAAACTSEYEDKELMQGVFVIQLFSKYDTGIINFYDRDEDKIDENGRNKLFDRIGLPQFLNKSATRE